MKSGSRFGSGELIPVVSVWIVTGLAFFAGTVIRLHLAFTDHGIYWPDEIFQSLEPAHYLTYGFGLLPWEFVEGSRNWVFPALMAVSLRISKWLGLEDPAQYLGITRVLLIAVSMGVAWGVFRLVRTLNGDRFSAVLAAALFYLFAPSLYFSHRALSETVSSIFVVFGFVHLLAVPIRTRQVLIGGLLLSIATFLRLQNGLFCLIALVALLVRPRAKFAHLLLVFVSFGLLYGLIDRLTWGSWFHSAIVNVTENVRPVRAVLYGSEDFLYFLRTFFSFGKGVGVAVIFLSLFSIRGRVTPIVAVIVFFLAHSLIPHKEFRFIYPALPLFFAAAGIGMSEIFLTWPRTKAPLFVVLILGVAHSVVTFPSLTFGEVGQNQWGRQVSAFDMMGSVNRLLMVAHRQNDLCAVKVEGVPMTLAGGLTYLHKEVPLYAQEGPERREGYFNYVISRQGKREKTIAKDGDFFLLKLPYETCREDANYKWRVN